MLKPKWEVVINNSEHFIGRQKSPASSFQSGHVAYPPVIVPYKKKTVARWNRALRVPDLHSLNGILADELSTEFVEYNQSGYWFIQIRDDVTIHDFDFVNLV